MLNLLLRNRLNITLLGFTRDVPKKRAGRIIGSFAVIVVFSPYYFLLDKTYIIYL